MLVQQASLGEKARRHEFIDFRAFAKFARFRARRVVAFSGALSPGSFV
jgi:hypothetical protein